MNTIKKVASFEEIKNLRGQYIFSLSGPLEPLIEEWIDYDANFYVLEKDNQQVAYFCVNSGQRLLQFYVIDSDVSQIQDIFSYLLSEEFFNQAWITTRDNLAVSVAMEFQRKVTVTDYLFQDSEKDLRYFGWVLTNFTDTNFRIAAREDIPVIHKVTKGFHDFLHYNLEDSIADKEIFVLYKNSILLGTGVIASKNCHPPYTDVGMYVNEDYRRQNVGTYILVKLKEYCYNNGFVPICSCHRANLASKKTLEKAGFVSKDRALLVDF